MATDKSVKGAESTAIQLPDTTGWATEQTGFAPYWNPEEGKFVFAKVVEKDDRDPEFTRYLMQAVIDTPCKSGPADDAEDITVSAGEFFTLSVYFSLQGLFDFYLESGLSPVMKITALNQVDTKKSGRSVWKWKVQVSPQDKKAADKARAQLASGRKSTEKQLPQSAESAS